MSWRCVQEHGARGGVGAEREQRAGKYPRFDACGTLVGESLPSFQSNRSGHKYLLAREVVKSRICELFSACKCICEVANMSPTALYRRT